MSEFLEIILQLIAECLFDCLDWGEYWRFGLPLLAGIAGATLLDLFCKHGGIERITGVLSVVGGISTGVLWQVRKR